MLAEYRVKQEMMSDNGNIQTQQITNVFLYLVNICCTSDSGPL